MDNELLEKLKSVFDNLFSNSEFKKILENIENKSAIDVITNFQQIGISYFFQDMPRFIDLLEFYKYFILNADKNFIKSNIIDRKIYDNIVENVKKALKINSSEVKRIYLSYKNSFKSKYPVVKLTETLLFYQKLFPNLLELSKNTTLTDFSDKVYEIFIETLENSEQEEFMAYIFDWLLKFGYLVEGFLIDILRTELQFHYLLKNIKYSYKRIMKMRFYQLLNELREDHTLRNYRNAIFHTNFIIEYQVNPEERKIIFLTLKNVKKEITIKKFIEYYFRLIQVVQSYQLAYTYAVPFSMREDGQIQLIEILDGLIKELKELNSKSEK